MDPVPPRITRRKHTGSVGSGSSTSTGSSISSNESHSSGTSPNAKKDSKRKKNSTIGLHLAPINTPLKFRLQTIGVIWHTISIPTFMTLFLFALYLGWKVWLLIILPYFIWWYGFDIHTPTNGKAQYRYREWSRNLIIWQWFVEYFPIRIHKSVDLEPTFVNVPIEDSSSLPDDEEDLISEDSRTLIDKLLKKLGLTKRVNVTSITKTTDKKYMKVSSGPRYIFGYHPHGVISMGVMGTFATNILQNEPYEPPLKILKPFFHDPLGKPRLLPDIGKIFPLTLTTQFTIPFYRDYLLSLGLTSASGKNVKSLINNGDNSVVIVVGGAQESLLNDVVASNSKYIGNGYKPQPYEIEELEEENENRNNDAKHREIRLVLNKRKGFVKIAIELGNISLVPIFAFGEADIYNVSIPKEGTIGYLFQQWMKRVFTFTVPFFSARGVFIYDFGFLPYRNPINLCMGRPIYIPAACLQEYLTKHPEEAADLVSTSEVHVNNGSASPSAPNTAVSSGVTRDSRSNSFSNLFKINQKSPKRTPPPKKKQIPLKLLDHYHNLYVDELKKVYEENKDKFGYSDVKLNIVE